MTHSTVNAPENNGTHARSDLRPATFKGKPCNAEQCFSPEWVLPVHAPNLAAPSILLYTRADSIWNPASLNAGGGGGGGGSHSVMTLYTYILIIILIL